MRLQQIELIKYGKFTHQRLDFPRGEHDFHLIVGANEAGKSTLRRAIAELLYGMPLRSEMDFVHPLAELRLGAVVESEHGCLAFHRARGRKSLRRPDDEVLAETELARHLGSSTSQAVFERMFCLDLAGLLEGGQTILDAADDVGQLLFQSAAGISSLGAVRDELADEAGKLYAPRKSGERAFYRALDQYEAARQALKASTVNTKQWNAANSKLEAVQAEIAQASERYNTLVIERQRLERLRRIAPRVAQLRDAQAEMQRLSTAVLFPADAAQRLAHGELSIATQSTALQLHQDKLASLQAQLDALQIDQTVLALAPQVEALAEQRQAVAQHPRSIERRSDEVQALLQQAAQLTTQLGWPADEEGIRAQLPSTLALKTLKTLAQDRGGFAQARQSAEENHHRAKLALERLQARQSTETMQALAPELAIALHEAQAFRQSPARQRTQQAALQLARQQLEQALAALSPWTMASEALAALVLPTEERIAALKTERASLAARADTAGQQHAHAREQARQSALLLTQFSSGRSLVTLDQVLQARQQRDDIWSRIKTQAEALDAAAQRMDQAIVHADHLVDSQRDSATDSAQLISLRQDSERDAAAEAARAQDMARADSALAAFDAQWIEDAKRAGLAGMALADISAWLGKRKTALEAAAAVEEKTLELQTECSAADQAANRLRAVLPPGGAGSEDSSLAELCASAEALISQQQAARAAAEMQQRQLQEAESELAHQVQMLQARNSELQQWQQKWRAALSAAHLDQAVQTDEAAAGAVELAENLQKLISEVSDKRSNSIQAMQRELSRFKDDAAALLKELALPVDDSIDAFDTAQKLATRLQQAKETKKEQERLNGERQAADAAVNKAQESLAAARAGLSTLYQLAGSEDSAVLRQLIAQSDRRQACEQEERQHRQAIVDAGDGLTLDALITDYEIQDPAALKPRLDELDSALAQAIDHKAKLAGELTQAQAELQRVHGGADAAVAEAKRLESLAQIGDAAERYIKVASATRLLRWAIDRYRERKQGPLLQRASALFSQMTLGRFERLAPDFEQTPPKLTALRAGGERVAIEGLSEGTRDQLFLALRLAALEMQMAGDRPLPFIADDLFVNFHDSRSRAGLAALGQLSRSTQVIFLTHHQHLVNVARECIGANINVVELDGVKTPDRDSAHAMGPANPSAPA